LEKARLFEAPFFLPDEPEQSEYWKDQSRCIAILSSGRLFIFSNSFRSHPEANHPAWGRPVFSGVSIHSPEYLQYPPIMLRGKPNKERSGQARFYFP